MSAFKTERIGEIRTGSDGNKAICTEYQSSEHIKIQFLDYDISYYTNWKRFNKGEFSLKHHKHTLRIGEQRTNRIGDTATCIKYINNEDITIQFENGDIREHVVWAVFDKGDFLSPSQLKENRLGIESVNRFGRRAICIEYYRADKIVIQFQDNNEIMTTRWHDFINGDFLGNTYQSIRLGQEKVNTIGDTGKIIQYNTTKDLYVQNIKTGEIIHTQWDHFDKGEFLFPESTPNQYGCVCGSKYPSVINGKTVKEYMCWLGMIRRCFDTDYKKRQPTYIDVTCSDDFKYYSNFYEFLHSQSNIDMYLLNKKWQLDKDIVGGKYNKIYSSDTTSLVPGYVNALFTKGDWHRREGGKTTPIGVHYKNNKYVAICANPYYKKIIHLGYYSTPEDAFYYGYKPYKENLIQKIAQNEYNQGNITERCYNAMMNYEVEITD